MDLDLISENFLETSPETDSENLSLNFLPLDESEDPTSVPNTSKPRPDYIPFPTLTKYEIARLLGVRALQLSLGAPSPFWPTSPSTIDIFKGCSYNPLDPLNIARQEFENGYIPLVIRRHLPDGSSEIKSASDLVPKQI